MNEKWLGGEAARLRVLGRREQLANRIERLEIGHRIRPRRPADRRLIDQHHVAHELVAFEPLVRADLAIPIALGALQRRVEHVVHERRLARSADAGDAGQRVERDLDVDALEVVLGGAEQPDALRRALAPRRRHRDAQLAAQILGRERARLVDQPLERARIHDAAAMLAGAESHVDDVIGDRDHVGVVFDHDHGVALIAQLPQDVDQPLVVARVQADRRLVQHVERARPAPSRATSPG